MNNSGNDVTLSITILIALLFAYCFPAFVALVRSHRKAGGVLAVNILLGWTLIGWGAALIWAFAGDSQKDTSESDRARGTQVRIEPTSITAAAMNPPTPSAEFLADGLIQGKPYRVDKNGSVLVLIDGAPIRFRDLASARSALS